MSCVNTFPKQSKWGTVWYQCALSSPPVQDTRYLWTFSKWEETDSIITLQLAILPILIEFAKCIRNL